MTGSEDCDSGEKVRGHKLKSPDKQQKRKNPAQQASDEPRQFFGRIQHGKDNMLKKISSLVHLSHAYCMLAVRAALFWVLGEW